MTDVKDGTISLKWSHIQNLNFDNILLVWFCSFVFCILAYYLMPYYYSGQISIWLVILINAFVSAIWVGIFKFTKKFRLQKQLVTQGIIS